MVQKVVELGQIANYTPPFKITIAQRSFAVAKEHAAAETKLIMLRRLESKKKKQG